MEFKSEWDTLSHEERGRRLREYGKNKCQVCQHPMYAHHKLMMVDLYDCLMCDCKYIVSTITVVISGVEC